MKPAKKIVKNQHRTESHAKSHNIQGSEFRIQNPILKKYLPHFIAILAIFIVNLFYFLPAFSGKSLQQGDIVSHKGMSKEAVDYYEKTGEVALWTNSMFSGMPTYQISAPQKHNMLDYVYKILRMGFYGPQGYFILGMLCFYIFLLVLGFNPWLSLIGSFAFSFMTNNIFLLEAGHHTKVSTIMLGPLVLAGSILIFKKKYLPGGLIFMISMGLQLLSNHVQMTYYLGFVIGVLVIIEFVRFIKEKDFKAIGIATIIFLAGIVLAVASSASKLWTTYEYSKETMRGKPILKPEVSDSLKTETKGLDWDYAMHWSNGVMDLFSTFIPGVVGGGSIESVSKNSEFAKKYREMTGSVPKDLKAPSYWGVLPSTSGPPYMGALIIFLFVFGIISIKSKYKWWALISVLLLFALSLGKNFEFFNRLFYSYFPLYNKFRTPNSIMGIAGIPLVFFAFYTLKHFISNSLDTKTTLRNLYITLGIAGGISLFFIVFGTSFFDFTAVSDSQYAQGGLDKIFQEDRKTLMSNDSIRTLVIVLLGFGIMWVFLKKYISANILIVAVGAIVFFDLITVDMRYVNHDSFVSNRSLNSNFEQREVDKQILADPDPYYRVFDTSVDPFNSSMPSYWHKNIGGYHAAKLQRYQDMIEKYISKGDMQVLNMLNTKYVIQKKENTEFFSQNPGAFGNAWFVDSLKFVENANQEIDDIAKTNVRTTAIINKEFENKLQNFDPDANGQIKLTSYSPNKLEYSVQNANDGFAVFSEVWYGEKGAWKAYIDEKPTDFVRVDYILRGMKVPAGNHKIKYEFKPASYLMGEKISLYSSLFMLLLSIGYLVFYFYRRKQD